MAAARKSKDGWLEAALEALAEGGIDAVRVEALARSLGVTKGSFYWHFSDRGDLLAALLDRWEDAGTQAIIAEVEAAGGGTRARARRLWKRTVETPHLAAELAIRTWARHEEAVATRVRRVDDRRMGYLRRLFGELCPPGDVEARCLLFYSLLIGNHFIVAESPGRTRAEVLDDCVESLLGHTSDS